MKILDQERSVVIEKQKYDPHKSLKEVKETISNLLSGEVNEKVANEVIRLFNVEESLISEIEVHAQNVRVLIQESNELLKEIKELQDMIAVETERMRIPSVNMP